ncbi:hypothetical protein [uncultured Albimonas sp.]|uniref:hypothetical protein n=1 Tax=uncultured Albimonas sp. TaxID=1331701 RepID=UPI0030EDEB0D|tara:strand:+ start:1690 stop:2397 length:708 start_codon:yes stop_codon:yes gene_type:complete
MTRDTSFNPRSAFRAGLLLAAVAAAGPAQAAAVHGLAGSFWDLDGSISSLAAARTEIEGRTPDATFRATTLDYPAGEPQQAEDGSTSLSELLGDNAEDLTGANPDIVSTSVWVMTGWLDLAPGTYSMSLGSDDGFSLSLNGATVAEHSEPRGFAYSDFTYEVIGSAPVAVSLLWYENWGYTGMEFLAGGTPLGGDALLMAAEDDPDFAAVPAPPAAALLVAAIAALGLHARRRRA